ncbi:hypothetical protein [Sphingorhabdus sp.]|jgi:hypothetical protein|uniref:hypothetical protein n=1 Tax=Sphingorhabdus sp. TaxID=1902408 RepID=UPI003BAF0CE0|nr:hypothetical protein [Sphingomonadales bacterium]MBK9433499.1 hypothetical protein [Sphingomonadales bacterium]MBL0020866.1 hypothetical protein [Sphingomonadales bacterium]
MADRISAGLYIQACCLRDRLRQGSNAEIREARDRLRDAMTAQYASGYWKDKPELLRGYMELLYRCDRILVELGPGLTGVRRKPQAVPSTPL